MDRELLTKMYTAVLKCRSISEKINSVEDLESSLVYDFLLSNLILIRDIESKLSKDIKTRLNFINWEVFKNYDEQLNNKLESNDFNIIYKIIKEELPDLQLKLENVIFSQ